MSFTLDLRPNQIYDFRGAFIDMAVRSGKLKDEDISLLANRTHAKGEWGNERDHYPLIQYRVEDGLACIFAVDAGVEVLEKVIHHKLAEDFVMRNRHLPFEVKSSYKQERAIKSSAKGETYLLFHYLPYDQYNDHEYHAAPVMTDKIAVLEQTIQNAILNTLKEFGIKIKEVKVTIVDIIHKDKATYKTKDKNEKPVFEELVSYFMKIDCNVVALDQIAIGKHKSLGYGVLKKLIK